MATLADSLVSGNTAPTGSEIIHLGGTFNLNHYNLLGDSSKTTAQALFGVVTGATDITATFDGALPTALAAILGPLADDGGPTPTHALVAGSPAIDMGDPAAMAGVGDVPEFDQRGAGFTRVANSRIDVGAYELQTALPPLPGDYNQNDVVDAADYVLWRKMLGQTGVTPFSGADGNGDGEITEADYDVWVANFGNTLPPPAAGAGSQPLSVRQSVAPHTSSVVSDSGNIKEAADIDAPSKVQPVVTNDITGSAAVTRPRTIATPSRRQAPASQSVDPLLSVLGSTAADYEHDATEPATFRADGTNESNDHAALATELALARWDADWWK